MLRPRRARRRVHLGYAEHEGPFWRIASIGSARDVPARLRWFSRRCRIVTWWARDHEPTLGPQSPRACRASTACGTRAPTGVMGRAVVSMLRTWLVRISPAIGRPSGRTVLVGNGRTREAIGQTIAKCVARQNATGDRTSAGRRPPCSRPVRGSKSVQIRSPSSGAGVTHRQRPRGRYRVPNRTPHAWNRTCALKQVGKPVARARQRNHDPPILGRDLHIRALDEPDLAR